MFISGALYPITDPDEWAERYALELRECPCMTCGEYMLINIPWATKELRGLKGDVCKHCGETKVPFVFTYK